MRFQKNNEQISYKDFSEMFPRQGRILSGHAENFPQLTLNLEELWSFSEEGMKLENIAIDLKKMLSYHQSFFYKHSIYKENLAKALGLKKQNRFFKVIDLSAGFLSDTALMLAMGLEVICYERNPYLACLIDREVEKLNSDKLHFFYGEYEQGEGDVFYFDPMYSEKNDKSAPKKQMQFLRQFIGVDEDAQEFILKIKEKKKRLVIKRSKKAPSLLENPSHQVIGKSTRYDVYF